MDIHAIGAGAGIVAVVGGVVLYVIRAEMRGDVYRLDGRIDTHEKACEERQKKLDERHQAISKHLENIDANVRTLVDKL